MIDTSSTDPHDNALVVDSEAGEACRQMAYAVEVVEARLRDDRQRVVYLLALRPEFAMLGLLRLVETVAHLLDPDDWTALLRRVQLAGAVEDVLTEVEVTRGR